MVEQAPLSDKMRRLAAKHPTRAVELREKADALDAASEKASEEGGPRKLLGAWARARRLYCEISGESLV